MISITKEGGWKKFIGLCRRMENDDALDRLFDLFLTKEEQEDIATRYLIVKELLDGTRTQREMAKDLKVSIAKITRGSNYLKLLDDRFKHNLKEELTEESN